MAEWETTLKGVGIDAKAAKDYAKLFEENCITPSNRDMLDKDTLKELGITILGHQMSILKIAKKPVAPDQNLQTSTPVRVATAKAPCLRTEMTPQQFRKFTIDWKVFLDITSLPTTQYHAQIYSNAEEDAQTAIITTYPEFFSIPTGELLDKIEAVVTRKANPMVHRVAFASMCQGDSETIQQYVIRLRASAKDCNFSCPSCHTDIADHYIKDQFVCGINNKVLQTDMLAKAELLPGLEATIKHAEAFEAALTDQSRLLNSAEVARVSQYKQTKLGGGGGANVNKQHRKSSPQPCTGCGGVHTIPYKRQEVCPAWGKKCAKCGVANHFARVCKNGSARQIQTDDALHTDDNWANMSALIAHVMFDKEGRLSEYCDRDVGEIDAIVKPFSTIPETRRACDIPDSTCTKLKIFPDSGASICLGGIKHLSSLGLSTKNLVPCMKVVTAVGNHRMTCMGYLPVEFNVNGQSTRQALYICSDIQRLYFSKKACIDVGLLYKDFPRPPISPVMAAATTGRTRDVSKDLPLRPQQTPYPPTVENIPKLKKWLVDSFEKTAFSKIDEDGNFPFMLAGPPAHIHLKEGAVPRARHNPIPVPFHMKEAVKKAIDEDVRKGILRPVPLGTTTKWCSTMVVQPKKDGRPRRTVDYQHLNTQCMRETHHQQSPFNLAMQVPAGAYKTVLDAVDGYHSVLLDEESQPLTTFITEWGRYMYTRMPQ